MADLVSHFQDSITHAIERVDGKPFREDTYVFPEVGSSRVRLLQEGNVFEKAG